MSTDAETKHDQERKKREQKIRQQAIRRVPMVEAPAAAQIIIENREWNRNVAKWSLIAAIVCVTSMLALSITLYKVATKEPPSLSYLVDQDGRMVRVESLSEPVVTDARLLMWASDRIQQIHSLAFTDYVDHIMGMSPYFTPAAFRNFQQSIIESKTIEKLKNQKLVMYMEPLEAPKIIQKGRVGGVYTWVVQMKIKQLMAGGEYSQTGNVMQVTMTIERVEQSVGLTGLVISKYLVKEVGDK